MRVVITQRILITLYSGHLPIAWGHLEPEGGKTWLGVSVAHGYVLRGNGSKIVEALCKYADGGGWDVWLTCHYAWAERWYKKFGFKVVRAMSNKDITYMKRKGGRA